MSSSAPSLARLREQIARIEGAGGRIPAFSPSTFPNWTGAFRVAASRWAACFAAGIAARLSRPVLWCVTLADLFAPGLALRRGRRPAEASDFRPAYRGDDALAGLGAALGALAGPGRGAAALARGVDPGARFEMELEGCDGAGRLGLVADVADGPAAAEGRRCRLAH